jgi:hypothetical protein
VSRPSGWWPVAPGCEPAIRLVAGCAELCAGLPGEAAGACRAYIGILFWSGFRCSPGTSAGLAGPQAGGAGYLQENSSKALLDDTKTMRRSHAGFKDLCRVT